MKTVLFVGIVAILGVAHAEDHTKAPHCRAIVEACKANKFIAGDRKNGDGLWAHCVHPILGCPANPKTPPMKAGMVVPTVAAADVQACKTEKPDICSGEKMK